MKVSRIFGIVGILIMLGASVYITLSLKEDQSPQESKAEEAEIDWVFRNDGGDLRSVIDTIGTYDYAPSAFKQDETLYVWTCGESQNGGDAVYFSSFKTAQQNYIPIEVMLPSPNSSFENSKHVCAPSVVIQGTDLIENGKKYYKMYFECTKKFYQRLDQTQEVEGYTQICHAVSTDGKVWKLYNEELWDSGQLYGNADLNPTPVIEAGFTILQNCEYKLENDKHLIGENCDLARNYGAGHPSALVIPVQDSQQIWLYFYDSKGAWEERGVYLAKSWDGFHFEAAVKTNLLNPVDVTYYEDQTNGTRILFATMVIESQNYLAYSNDGIQWKWYGNTEDTERLKLGQASSDLCAVPSQARIVSDTEGRLSSLQVQIFSAEGNLGLSDGIDSTGRCFSAAENSKRGSTWKLFLISGHFETGTSANVQVCGDIDINKDNKLTIKDLAAFAQRYGSVCQNKEKQGKTCGGKDTDNNNKVDILDLENFSSKYNVSSCI